MELSCRLGGHSLHLLAYHVDPAHAGLAEQRHAIATDRLRRGREMVGRLRELGVDITWEQVAAIAGDAVVGRPHIARAMVAAGAWASSPSAPANEPARFLFFCRDCRNGIMDSKFGPVSVAGLWGPRSSGGLFSEVWCSGRWGGWQRMRTTSRPSRGAMLGAATPGRIILSL
jgi:hypothetical protein